MTNRFDRKRNATKTNRVRAVRPVLEGLEDRKLLYSTTAGHFAYGSRITWSIVPDGTNLGGPSSNLISSLNQQFGSSGWINAFQDAFARWERSGSFNLVQVGDNGDPVGSGAYQQGNPNFGDIRIGGYYQGSNSLAYALLPPPNNGYSDSSDIFFNTAQPWSGYNSYDMETVAFHEIGHALGLGHSADSDAAMYSYYNAVKQTPNQDDVNGIVAAWGSRTEDAIAKANNNFTINAAANINGSLNGSTNQIVLPNQNVVSPYENYWFKFTTPANTSNNLTVQIQSSNLSSLSPRVVLYNSQQQGLIQAIAPSYAYGSTISVSISNATPNTVYYIKVLSSNTGASGAGAYALTVNMGNNPINPVAPPYTMVLNATNQGGGASYERVKIGGANNPSNTEVDIPEKVQVGDHLADSDSLLVPTSSIRSHRRLSAINRVTPVHVTITKHHPKPKATLAKNQTHHS